MTQKKNLLLVLAATCGLGLVVVPALAGETKPAAATAEDGKKIWNDASAKCAKCHGEDGKAQTKMGKKLEVSDMTTAEWQKKFTDQQIKDAILKGVDREEDGKKRKMKPMKGATAEQADALLAFIRSLGPKK